MNAPRLEPSCHAPRGIHGTLKAVVNDYLRTRAEGEARYLRFYQVQRSLPDAIEKAAMAELPGGRRFSHQRRIPRVVLQRAKEALLAVSADLAACGSFDQLHALVEQTIEPIRGVGRLMVYDTAHRLGAYLRLSPDLVYVHAGVQAGLRVLGLDHRAAKVSLADLPAPFARLRPEQVEDCLCIYKRQFSRITP